MKHIDEPFDEEERALMDAVENSDAKPLPKAEADKIRQVFKDAKRSWHLGATKAIPKTH